MKTWQMYTRALISAATIAASAVPGHPGSPRRSRVCPLLCGGCLGGGPSLGSISVRCRAGVGPADLGSA